MFYFRVDRSSSETPAMNQFLARCSILATIGFVLLVAPAWAQPKVDPKAKPVDKPTTKPADKPAEPATVEAAAKVLDLRKFAVMDGAKLSSQRTLAMLMYDAKASPKDACEFQRKQLLKLGFKELPGGYADAMTHSARFTNAGFQVAVSTS